MNEHLENADEKEFLTSRILSSKVSQRSELAQEFISRKSGVLEQWSLFIFLVVLLLLLASTWFIQYPDIIETRAILTAENAPKEIISIQDGRLVKLFIHNNKEVAKNQIIAWIENTASHEEIIDLSKQLDSSTLWLNSDKPEKVFKLFNKSYNDLGEIQPRYQQFIVSWQLYNDYLINGFYLRKKQKLEEDILTLNGMRKTIESQKSLTEKDLSLAKETFNANKSLFEKQVLSNEEFRNAESRYVNKEMVVPQLEASILGNETLLRDKSKEIEQLNHDMIQQKVIFQQAIQSLKSEVSEWLRKYVIKAPIEGKISFIVSMQENKHLQSGRILGYVNPVENRFYVETHLSQKNFGKIDTGLSVQLRFDAYPYQELGFIEGKLQYISNVPSDSGFLANIKLNNGLITNNNNRIPYKNGLKANAIIITKNMRLLQRFYYDLVKATSMGNK
ncbi:MAG TPA: HlyD family efflux transporter periplasmic adaptor subunit [Pedobacter sp.]|uniref:HlyD family efflux transporter periplasmic adaptor subunit n=1 Tax=Pedobacter sp. TaxID=1411316 RepID=UPI002C61B051|nr:HlyD family efflux transporter periplasmic adaptor subunit [Pedobacter sp.]HMI02722.1 HlyD family efflux transporter periplasmic adaptor subunit [Pedobacter sp.]